MLARPRRSRHYCRAVRLPTPAALLALVRSEAGRKLIRYGTVSAVGVVITQLTLSVLYKALHVDATAANITAVAVSTVPCFLLSKRWVWGRSGRSHLMKEVVPFWGFALAGLVLSTVFVHWVKQHTASLVWINGASLSGFGLLWVGRFVVLDRLIWGPHHHTPLDTGLDAGLDAELSRSREQDRPRRAPAAVAPNQRR